MTDVIRPTAPEPAPAAQAFEVGSVAEDGTLRLWLARESLRQGELRLSGQTLSLTAMEGRATAIIGWMVPIGLALVGAAINPVYRGPAIAAGVCLLIAALSAGFAVWPRNWSMAGWTYAELRRSPYSDGTALETELEHLEALGKGLQTGILRNDVRLSRFAWALQLAWGAMLAAPIAAGVAAWVAGVRP